MTGGEVRTVRLDGELTIYRAAEIKPALLAGDEGVRTVEIDLRGVSEIDTTGVQLLMLAQRETHADGRAWRLAGRSPAVDEAFDLLNLQGHFAA